MDVKGPAPPKFLEHLVILCFERRYLKQNTVASLKSTILPPRAFIPKKILGGLRHLFMSIGLAE